MLANLLEGQGKCNDLGILLVGVDSSTIGNHILVHLVKLDNGFRGCGEVLHDPLTFKLVNKDQELLGRRGANCMKAVCDEMLVRVGCRTGLSMNLLKKSHHPRHQEAHIVLVIWP
jgi:hypothetical protein